MARIAVCVGLLAFIVLPVMAQPAAEQERDLDQIAAEQKLQERIAFFEEMGLPGDAATGMAIFAEAGMDPAQIALMFMMRGEQGGEQAMLPMLLMNSMKGAAPLAPAMVERDGRLFIAEGGMLYVIDEETLEVVSTIEYAPKPPPEDSPIWSLLAPMFGAARHKAEQSACMNNLKQLGLAFMMYLEDHDGWLPDGNWVEATYPYIKNRQVYTCASRPEQAVGYALNEALLPQRVAELENPSQAVLAFETLEPGEAPVGGAGLVPPDGIHEGGIDVCFADGHVEWMPAEQAQQLLQQGVQ